MCLNHWIHKAFRISDSILTDTATATRQALRIQALRQLRHFSFPNLGLSPGKQSEVTGQNVDDKSA